MDSKMSETVLSILKIFISTGLGALFGSKVAFHLERKAKIDDETRRRIECLRNVQFILSMMHFNLYSQYEEFAEEYIKENEPYLDLRQDYKSEVSQFKFHFKELNFVYAIEEEDKILNMLSVVESNYIHILGMNKVRNDKYSEYQIWLQKGKLDIMEDDDEIESSSDDEGAKFNKYVKKASNNDLELCRIISELKRITNGIYEALPEVIASAELLFSKLNDTIKIIDSKQKRLEIRNYNDNDVTEKK
jgi:hypothetical protein